MSNFTDFNQLAAESDVALRYVASPKELHGADVIILPGSKTTIADLDYLRKAGFDDALTRHGQQGREIIGVCGGFQMLGKEISDPQHVETGGSSKGLGLLEIETKMLAHKQTVQVRAHTILKYWDHESLVEGYEIHMGVTRRAKTVLPCFQILSDNVHSSSEQCEQRDDGGMRADGLVWGTYIHGVFDQPTFRRQWLNRLRVRKKLAPLEVETSQAVSDRLAHALDRWADHVEKHVNISPIFSVLKVKRF